MSKRLIALSLGMALAFTLALGCTTSSVVEDKTASGTEIYKPAQADNLYEATRPADEAGADYKPAQGAADSSDEAKKLIGAIKMGQEERDQAFKHFLRNGRELNAKGQFESAERSLEEALNLRPNDPEAMELLAEIREKLGRTSGKSYRNLSETVDRERRRVTEGLAEIRQRYQKARKLFEERNFADCITILREALEIARWFRGRIDTSGEERQIKSLIARAQESQEEKRKYDIMHARELVEAMREVEKRNRINRFKEEMRILIEAAKDQFDREQYEECLITLGKILWKDPYNREAAKLREYTRQLKYKATTANMKNKLVRMWRTAIADIEEAATPFIGDLYEASLPSMERWREIEIRADKVIERSTDEMDPSVMRIKDALKQKQVPVGYQDKEFGALLRDWSELSNVNFNPHASIREDVPDMTVDVEPMGQMSLWDAMNIVIKKRLNLDYYIENGMVIICAEGEAAGKGVITRIFNVKDLLGGYKMFPGEPIPVGTTGSQAQAPIEDAVEPIQIELDELVDVITGTISPDTWDDVTGRLEMGPNGTIIARHKPEVLAQVSNLLDDLRQSRGLMVTIECRFIEIQDNFLEELGIDYRGAGGVPPGSVGPNLTAAPLDDFQFGLGQANIATATPVLGRDTSTGIYWSNAPDSELRARVEQMFDYSLGDPDIMTSRGGTTWQLAYLDELQISAILRATKKKERMNLVTAPKITCFNTQRSNITIRNQVAYIEDFNVEARQNVSIADPVVGTIEDGLVLDMRPVISADRRYITVEMRPTIALLQRPMDTLTTTLGGAGSTPVTIQLPEMKVQRVQTTVIVPDGGAFVIGGLRKKNEVSQSTGIPLISDIPILGNLFKRKGRSNLRSELVIMIKARITDLREMADLYSPSYVDSGTQPR